MSRNRYDRDDRDYYGEGSRGGDDRYGSERGGYSGGGGGRGSGALDRDYGSEDPYRSRSFSRSAPPRSYGRDDYGRNSGGGGGYTDRDDYAADERRYSGYSETSSGARRVRPDYDRGEDRRSWYEDERDDRREQAGRSRSGASRSHVRCRDIMTRDVTVATRDTSLQEVASMMRDEDTGVIPVVDREGAPDNSGGDASQSSSSSRARGNGRLVGLVTDRDIVIRALAEEKDARTTRVEEVMTTDVHTAQPNDRVIEVIRKMGDKQVRRIPVVDENNNLRGIISMADVALETEEDRELADALEEISSGSSFWSKIFG
jgi:CBS domain-containing protein